MVAVDIT